MADFSSLKQTIQTYIKQNGNEEITGNILQDVLLAMVTTMGDSAINGLVSALQDEITARQNQYGTLQGNITAETTARRDADTALGGRIDGLQTAINGINTKLAEGYIYAGIATPSTNPGTISGKVFYIAVQAGTYTDFGNTIVKPGISILKYNGSAWSNEQVIYTDGGVFDVSAYNGGATYASLEALLSDANLSTIIPSAVRKGGMSIKFVQSSDNKYVQFRCKAQSFTTDVEEWESLNVDNSLISCSKNLAKSGVVFDKIQEVSQVRPQALEDNGNLIVWGSIIEGSYYDPTDGTEKVSSSWNRTPLFEIKPNTPYAKSGTMLVMQYDAELNYLGYIAMATTQFVSDEDAMYFGCIFAPAYQDTARINEGYTLNDFTQGIRLYSRKQLKGYYTDLQNLSTALVENQCEKNRLGDYFINNGVVTRYDGQTCYYVKVVKGQKLQIKITTENAVTLRYGLFNEVPTLNSITSVYGSKSVSDVFEYTATNNGYFTFSVVSTVTAIDVYSLGCLTNKINAVVGKNKFNKDAEGIVTGKYLALDDGQPYDSPAFEYLYIELKPNTKYVLSGFSNNAVVTFYQSNGSYISGVAINLATNPYFTTPSNMGYLGLSVRIIDADAIQLEEGQIATSYSPYQMGVGSDEINDGAVIYSKLGEDVSIKKVVRVGANRLYTSILEGLKAAGENAKVIVDAGTYDIEAEYKAFYGNDFFSNYPMDGYHQHYDDLFYSGLYLDNGVELIANGLVTIIFPYPDGLRVTDVPVAERTRENFDPVAQYFSIINTSENNVIDGIDISLVLNNCRYHIHDDFAYESGMNIFRNMHLYGQSQKLTAFGCGMGTKNQYVIENCYINNGTGYSISYHNSVDAGKNKLIIKNVWCSGNIMVRMYGASTEKTEVIVSGCKANAIVRDYVDQVTYPNENMELIAWNNNTNS